MDDIIFKTTLLVMFIAFPLFYIASGLVNTVRYLKAADNNEKVFSIRRSVSTANSALLIWCLLLLIGYCILNYTTVGRLYDDLETEIWFFFPLVIIVILLLFKRIRGAVFAWLFFVACITTGWIFFITFFKLSLF